MNLPNIIKTLIAISLVFTATIHQADLNKTLGFDPVTPAALQKDVATHYNKVAGLKFESHIISGDHAYSSSRIQLQKLVVNWMFNRCR